MWITDRQAQPGSRRRAGKPRPPTWAAGIARCENPDEIPAGVVSIEKVK